MSLTRVSLLLVVATVFASLVSAAPGCTCAPTHTVVTPGKTTIAFDGLPPTIDCATTLDADPIAEGFQIQVGLVFASDEECGFTTVLVTNSSGDFLPGEGTFDASGHARVTITVAANAETPGAENTLTATARDPAGEAIATTGSLLVICQLPTPPPACRFTAPLDGAPFVTSPASVSVQCTGGDPDSALQQTLLLAGAVIVTATPTADPDAPSESVQLDLVGGTATGELDLPELGANGAATLTLVLADPAGVFDGPVGDSIDVTLEVALAVITILFLEAGADDLLNIADNEGRESTALVTADVIIGLTSSATGVVFTGTTEAPPPNDTCTGTAEGSLVVLVGCQFPQGSSDIVVSALGLSSVGATKTMAVDTLAPGDASLTSLVQGATLTVADDDDVNTPGLQTAIVVASDDDGALITVRVDGEVAGSGTVSGGGVTIAVTIGEGAHTVTIDIADDAGNIRAAIATANVTVDSAAPTLLLVAASPLDGDEDLDAVALGIQVDVTVTPTGLSAGRIIAVISDLDDVISGVGCLSGGDGIASVCRVSYISDGVHVVGASAVDEAGNVATSAALSVTANTGLVGVSIDSPPLRDGVRSIGIAEDTDPGADAQVIVAGETRALASVQLFIDDVVRGAPVQSDATGAFAIAVTLSNGDTGTFEVRVDGNAGSSGIDPFHVDLGRPTTTFVSPAGPSVTFLPADDTSPAAGLQLNVTVAVTECQNGVVQVFDGSTLIGSEDVAASGTGSIVIAIADLTEGAAETWTATCADADGNTPLAPDTLTVTVDITAPNAPAITLTVTSVRRGQLTVSFTEPGDNGAGGGNVTSLALIASRQAITAVNFDTLAVSPVTAGGGGLINSSVVGAGSARSMNVSGLAFDNAWNFALRTRDDVGNEALGVQALLLADFDTSRSTFTHPESDINSGSSVNDAFAGSASGSGDINGDLVNDIVALASNQGDLCISDATDTFCEGAVHIIGGGGDLGAGAEKRIVTPPAGASNFGTSAAILDLDNDGNSDLVVHGFADDLSEGRIYVYYGIDGPTFVNAAPEAVLSVPVFTSDTVQAVGDVSNDGFEDFVLVGSFATDVEAVLVRGSATPLTSGEAAEAPTATTIQLTTAGGGATVFLPAATGLRGSVNGDAFGDFVLVTDGIVGTAPVNQLWPVLGRAVWPATLDLGGDVATPIACAGAACGQSSLTAGDFDGDGDQDLVVPSVGRLDVFFDVGATLSLTSSLSINAPGLFLPNFGGGQIGIIGDINGDGFDDIAAPRRPAGATVFSVYFGQSGTANRTQSDIDYTVPASATDSPSTPVCGNFDNDDDGFDELCFVTQPGDDGSIVMQR